MNLSEKYLQLESALLFAGLDQSVSEVHGIIAGSIANHMYTSKAPNLLFMLVGERAGDDKFAPLTELLNEIYRETSEELFDSDEGFELLMPDEEAKLSVRTEGLASWCSGYTLGLLYRNLVSVDQLPEDSSEIVRDLLSISEAAPSDEGEENEEDEWALAELEEYVKVGAKLIFESIVRFRSEQQVDAPLQ